MKSTNFDDNAQKKYCISSKNVKQNENVLTVQLATKHLAWYSFIPLLKKNKHICVCMCIYTHTNIYTQICIYIHIYKHINMYISIYWNPNGSVKL